MMSIIFDYMVYTSFKFIHHINFFLIEFSILIIIYLFLHLITIFVDNLLSEYRPFYSGLKPIITSCNKGYLCPIYIHNPKQWIFVSNVV